MPGVVESFTNAALVQWKEHQRVITHDNKLQNQFETALINDVEKRHKLIEQSVLAVSMSEGDPYFLLSSLTETVLVPTDFFWMLENFQNSNTQGVQRIWAQLTQWSFNRQDAKEIDALITATQSNDVLDKVFGDYFEAVELNSAKAETMKAYYLETQERQNRRRNPPALEPPPKERVLQLLDQLEAENLDAWWQLNREMTLKPNSRHYISELELDLTKLDGWKEADEVTQRRIIEGAKKYIHQQNEIAYDWIGTNTYNRPALAGCRALYLLSQKAPDSVAILSSEIWERWTPVIIGFPSGSQNNDCYLELVKLAYLNAPHEATNTLMTLIDRENHEHDYLFITSKFKKCWDDRLKLVLLEKARDPSLKPKCMGQLLECILQHELDEARKFAESLVSFPLPLAAEERERVLIAAKVLIENSDSSSWLLIWSVIQQDASFGREVLELVADRYSHGIQLNLSEEHLADLYIWLAHQYPRNEDPDYSNEVLAHFVTARESIGNLRDNVLFQLKERGTLQACSEIQRVSQEFPDMTWLKKTLLDAQRNMRRRTWQPPQVEQVFRIVSKKELQIMRTILILASSPVNEARLRLDKEVREIDEGLRRSQKRDQFRLEKRGAVQTDDLRRALLDTTPQVVHFCGHGAGDEGLVIEDEDGKAKLVSTEALANLFELCSDHVECVLLNACYSEIQADAIAQHIPYVVGMSDAVGDTAAIKFAVGFYDALGAGKSIEVAYKFGCNAIQLESIPEHLRGLQLNNIPLKQEER